MFTGLIEEVGTLTQMTHNPEGILFEIKAEKVLDDLKRGDSVAVDGACLSVVSVFKSSFTVQAIQETLDKTTLRFLHLGMGVNLERAMMTNGRLGGHFIQGHVDGIAPITSILKKGESALLTVQIPEQLRQYVAVKGSIAINGISLTVANVSQDLLTVAIIPLTFQETTLYTKKKGDFVNLEVDILAKYVLNFLTKGSQQKNNLLNKLHEWGYENNKGNHEF